MGRTPWGSRLSLILALSVWLVCPRALADEAPFALQGLRVPGRPLQAHSPPAPPRDGPRGVVLIVASVEGLPPEEARWLTGFRSLGSAPAGLSESWRIAIPPDVVFFDFALLGPEAQLTVALLTPLELRLIDPQGGRKLRTLSLEPSLPLPRRARGLARLDFLRDWQGTGSPSALLPTLDGGLLLSLEVESASRLQYPVLSEYLAGDGVPPTPSGLFEAHATWPTLLSAQDDGDGRADLFALSRFGVDVFRSGEDGFPERPTRSMRVAPFSFEEELRHEATALRFFVQDLDGDGLGDVVLHRTSGTLFGSRSSTEVHRNPGSGARVTDAPSWKVEDHGSIATVDLVDLDADGRTEIVQTRVRFNLLQVVRLFATSRVEVELRVFCFSGPELRGAEESFRMGLSYALDMRKGRIDGLLALFTGDWNGDGRRDLVVGQGSNQLEIRLGQAEALGPGFGRTIAKMEVPAADRALITDLDGDGLDDLILYDPRDLTGAVHVLHNLGTLPGARPVLRPASRETEPGVRTGGPGLEAAEDG